MLVTPRGNHNVAVDTGNKCDAVFCQQQTIDRLVITVAFIDEKRRQSTAIEKRTTHDARHAIEIGLKIVKFG